jgi:membrane protease YdiL (CAAX protease family)
LLFGSLVFAQVHLYQSQNSMELIEIFTITFLGSVFFAWIYIEQGFNLWSAIFLHESVLGNLYCFGKCCRKSLWKPL